MARRVRAWAVVVLVAVLGAEALAQDPAAQKPEPIQLWPQGAPGALGKEPGDVPTITVYPAPAADKGPVAAIVVCPGGGYGGLAAHEAEPIAKWLNTLGITGVVLKYRLGPRYHHPARRNRQ